jgi:hypothetical protein
MSAQRGMDLVFPRCLCIVRTLRVIVAALTYFFAIHSVFEAANHSCKVFRSLSPSIDCWDGGIAAVSRIDTLGFAFKKLNLDALESIREIMDGGLLTLVMSAQWRCNIRDSDNGLGLCFSQLGFGDIWSGSRCCPSFHDMRHLSLVLHCKTRPIGEESFCSCHYFSNQSCRVTHCTSANILP